MDWFGDLVTPGQLLDGGGWGNHGISVVKEPAHPFGHNPGFTVEPLPAGSIVGIFIELGVQGADMGQMLLMSHPGPPKPQGTGSMSMDKIKGGQLLHKRNSQAMALEGDRDTGNPYGALFASRSVL